jgi:hypothetical protein
MALKSAAKKTNTDRRGYQKAIKLQGSAAMHDMCTQTCESSRKHFCQLETVNL